MRSLMSYYFTEMYGAEQKQYLDANNYNNTKRNHATIVKLIATLKRATTTTDYTYTVSYTHLKQVSKKQAEMPAFLQDEVDDGWTMLCSVD